MLPYRTLDNVIEGAVITFVDISAVAHAERELRRTQAILEVAFDHSQTGFAVADAPTGTLRYLNDAALLVLGADRTSIEQASVDNYNVLWPLINFDGRPVQADEMPLTRAVLLGETSTGEFVIRRSGEDDRVVLINAVPIRDDVAAVVAAVASFTDVTERHNRIGTGVSQYMQANGDSSPETPGAAVVADEQ